MARAVGIDLGTTNSAIAVLEGGEGGVALPVGADLAGPAGGGRPRAGRRPFLQGGGRGAAGPDRHGHEPALQSPRRRRGETDPEPGRRMSRIADAPACFEPHGPAFDPADVGEPLDQSGVLPLRLGIVLPARHQEADAAQALLREAYIRSGDRGERSAESRERAAPGEAGPIGHRRPPGCAPSRHSRGGGRAAAAWCPGGRRG